MLAMFAELPGPERRLVWAGVVAACLLLLIIVIVVVCLRQKKIYQVSSHVIIGAQRHQCMEGLEN